MTRNMQAIVAICGVAAISLGLFVVYLIGSPVEGHREGGFHDVFDLLSYLFPVLAAVSAGMGLFARYPGLPVDQSVPSQALGPGDLDLKAYFSVSIALLLLGVLSYAFSHVCTPASVLVISNGYLITATIILWGRTPNGQDAAKPDIGSITLWTTTVVTASVVLISAYYANTLFFAGQCVE